MTTYTAILSAETDPGSPVKSDLMKRFSDNPIAMLEGASGAPRLLGEAAARFGNGLPILTVAAAATFVITNGMPTITTTPFTTSTTEVAAFTSTLQVFTGAARFSAGHLIASGGTSTLSVYKNGTLVQSWTTTSTTTVTRTVDISFVTGDVIEWRHKTNSGTYRSDAYNPAATASNNYTSQPVLIKGTNI